MPCCWSSIRLLTWWSDSESEPPPLWLLPEYGAPASSPKLRMLRPDLSWSVQNYPQAGVLVTASLVTLESSNTVYNFLRDIEGESRHYSSGLYHATRHTEEHHTNITAPDPTGGSCRRVATRDPPPATSDLLIGQLNNGQLWLVDRAESDLPSPVRS